MEIAFRGGFPEVTFLKMNEYQQWHRDYITALLERDLVGIAQITRHHAMRDLVEILAAWSVNL